MKQMDIKEFTDLGYLQEANRRFFHPLGLSLVVGIDNGGYYELVCISDNREDPEGIMWSEERVQEDTFQQKAELIDEEVRKRRERRLELFGKLDNPLSGCQPIK